MGLSLHPRFHVRYSGAIMNDREMVRIELGSLGVIEGDDKRALEVYVDERLFKQRKTFDEYTIEITTVSIQLDIRDLMIIADNFTVRILDDCIILTDKF